MDLVLRSAAITDGTRVLLLTLALSMSPNGRVSGVTRLDLAIQLRRSERRITERLAAAADAELLEVLLPGAPGRSTVYQARLSARIEASKPVRARKPKLKLVAGGQTTVPGPR